jgi:hypothetical protein
MCLIPGGKKAHLPSNAPKILEPFNDVSAFSVFPEEKKNRRSIFLRGVRFSSWLSLKNGFSCQKVSNYVEQVNYFCLGSIQRPLKPLISLVGICPEMINVAATFLIYIFGRIQNKMAAFKWKSLPSSGRFIFQEKTLFFFSQVDSSPI